MYGFINRTHARRQFLQRRYINFKQVKLDFIQISRALISTIIRAYIYMSNLFAYVPRGIYTLHEHVKCILYNTSVMFMYVLYIYVYTKKNLIHARKFSVQEKSFSFYTYMCVCIFDACFCRKITLKYIHCCSVNMRCFSMLLQKMCR